MKSKSIQEQFGQELIDAVARFAKKEIGTPEQLEEQDFKHVADNELRKALAETLYGARWLYKLGLALLANGDEQSAHVRVQVIDYASICEALLADMIVQAHAKGVLAGDQHTFFDVRKKSPMNWGADPRTSIHKTTFEWRIIVSQESGIIDSSLATSLHTIRNHRNTVHLTLKIREGVAYYAGMARRAHTAMRVLISQTQKWTKSLD
ncbi:hypothetical protein G7021_19160 [Pseudomonas carnis]|uniref:hypothetical protein n=1 Tax=Pseudomonas TaxID=286 RepID=UPI0002F6B473|nr:MULTISPECIES: hypothetical protein [Pseudomonas]MBA1254776.1 hypothetical protein [Pseudomonas carnis]MBP0942725.1 hypothetical protein [Pseudomonas alliivorans]MEE4880820.1 hypothetical protein [Pseudomonas alliivorans]MEE4932317.1 hypothetical protein [Pseudomonas alliivorans]MEE4937705.1 hypothetical protein [Pseudomonas alliivorans]